MRHRIEEVIPLVASAAARWMTGALLLVLLCSLTACNSTGNSGDEGVIQESEAGVKAVYQVYYMNLAGNDLISVPYETEETDLSKLCMELVGQMKLSGFVPETAEGYQSVFGEGEEIVQITVETSVAKVRFASYSLKDSAGEVLRRAALTKTLVGIAGVDYVYMMQGEQPVMEADQTAIGFMSASDFVSIVGKDVNSYNRTSLVLYFANEDGTGLLGEKIDITYSNTFSVEQYVVERLIEGPESEGLYPTLPSTVRVLAISVKDGTCYVNLDESFVSQALDVDAYVAIYSIVNSLTELPNITNVRITVTGASDIVYKDVVPLDNPIERNLDYYGGLVY